MEQSKQPPETSRISVTPGVAAVMETDEVQSGGHNEKQTSGGNLSKCHRLMYRAALKGDWQAAEKLLSKNLNLASDPITKEGDTALHMAAASKQTKFVKELVKQISSPSDLSFVNRLKCTPFGYAAASGIVDIASAMMGKNKNLSTICSEDNMLPLHMAVKLGNRDMASYIEKHTQVEDYLSEHKMFTVFKDTIRNGMYDVALQILKRNGHLATMRDHEGTALHVLAQHDISTISDCREAILKRCVTMFAAVRCLSWLRKIFEQPLMRKKARSLAKKLWTKIQQEEMNKLMAEPLILHDAAKAGNVEFITMLTHTDPELIWHIDSNDYTMFHIAVSARQESVFKLIRQVGAVKYLIAIVKDTRGNNILHLAGEMAPPDRLSVVSGEALQMQRELMWFKETERILPPFVGKEKNEKGLRPRELFSQEHVDLLEKGATWMRETADSFMLIATIMLTVAFTAAFTVPGGNNSETGIPVLFKKSWFKIFLASNAVAMFCATFSIIMFLSIRTSRFQEDDFLVRLPLKLLGGLFGLFGSLVGSILAFTSSYFLMYNEERAWLHILLGSFPCVLLTVMFLSLHIRLFIDTAQSTFQSRFLFGPSKHSLYGKITSEQLCEALDEDAAGGVEDA